jgi:hypothetical protein
MRALSAVDTSVTSSTWLLLPWLLIRTKPPLVGANWYCWAFVPLQVYCWIAVPFVVPPARASTHLPLFLLTTAYQAVGEIGPVVGGVVPPAPPSHRMPLISHWFCWALSNVDDVRVLVL